MIIKFLLWIALVYTFYNIIKNSDAILYLLRNIIDISVGDINIDEFVRDTVYVDASVTREFIENKEKDKLLAFANNSHYGGNKYIHSYTLYNTGIYFYHSGIEIKPSYIYDGKIKFMVIVVSKYKEREIEKISEVLLKINKFGLIVIDNHCDRVYFKYNYMNAAYITLYDYIPYTRLSDIENSTILKILHELGYFETVHTYIEEPNKEKIDNNAKIEEINTDEYKCGAGGPGGYVKNNKPIILLFKDYNALDLSYIPKGKYGVYIDELRKQIFVKSSENIKPVLLVPFEVQLFADLIINNKN